MTVLLLVVVVLLVLGAWSLLRAGRGRRPPLATVESKRKRS